jgi:chromosome segregation ATPase
LADEVYTKDPTTEKPKDKLDRLLDGEENAEISQVDIRAAESKPPGMSLLAKLFPGNDEVSKLEASIAENDTLRADLIAAQSRIAELVGISEANATLQGEVTALTTKLTDAESALKTATAEIAEKDEAIAAAKESAGAEATQILASIGQPEPLPINGETNEPQAITREQFNALDHIARNKFIAGGGKIK